MIRLPNTVTSGDVASESNHRVVVVVPETKLMLNPCNRTPISSAVLRLPVLTHCGECGECAGHLFASQLQRTAENGYPQGSACAHLQYDPITEQALTLNCDDASTLSREGGRQVALPRLLARYFRGPHFDWGFDAHLPAHGVPTVDLAATQMSPQRWAWNASGGSRLVVDLAVHSRRVLMFSKRRPYFERHFGHSDEILSKALNLEGCLLRYLLAPRGSLQRVVRDVTGLHADGRALMATAAMHVRVGDREFAHEGWATGRRWYAADEVRRSPYEADPAAALACLERLSDGVEPPAATAAGRTAFEAAWAGGARRGPGGCMRRCLVLSDSVRVEACARRTLARPVTTPGVPVHLSASAAHLAADATNVQRIFLDWLLLAQSRATLALDAWSTFVSTAYAFKAASAPPSEASDPHSTTPALPSLPDLDQSGPACQHTGALDPRLPSLPAPSPRLCSWRSSSAVLVVLPWLLPWLTPWLLPWLLPVLLL